MLPDPPTPVPPRCDLRDMLRAHIRRRSLECLRAAEDRRRGADNREAIAAYQGQILEAVRGFYPGGLDAGPDRPAPAVRCVGHVEREGFRIENLLFETEPGWEVNANLYLPADVPPPWPGIVVAVGHSGKQFENYQLPSQYFALAGYAAICFDPPGQASEKQPGNDHFADGLRAYLLGDSSSRYFIADAIRCVDVLYAREDVNTSRGVAMTGVSGGGTTTTIASLLDERIVVSGPSCCLTPLADGDVLRAYSGCPETHQIGRYARGVDEMDLLCAAAPRPTLLMQGDEDSLFTIDTVRMLSGEVAGFYERLGAAGSYELFVDAGRGHCYSLEQARAFAAFAGRWLREDGGRELPATDDARIALLDEELIACRPRTDVNMRTLYSDRARRLAEQRRHSGADRDADRIRSAAGRICHVDGRPAVPACREGVKQAMWEHTWQSLSLDVEDDIELPATFAAPRGGRAGAILVFDDAGRTAPIAAGGPLGSAIGMFEEGEGAHRAMLSVDLRGWGDTRPAFYPYDAAGWGSMDRWCAHASAALDDGVMAMRVRDGLAALAWLRSREEVDARRIAICGFGAAGVVALHVAAIDAGLGGNLAGVVCWESLSSFADLLAAERYDWPAETFLPGAAAEYDLPELAAAAGCPVSLINPRTGSGAAAGVEEIPAIRAAYGDSAEVELAHRQRHIQRLREMTTD